MRQGKGHLLATGAPYRLPANLMTYFIANNPHESLKNTVRQVGGCSSAG